MAEKITLNVGLFGIGLNTYWEQFEDLNAQLKNYLSTVHAQINADFVHCINYGLIDTVDGAFDTGHACRQQQIDLLLIHSATYALSASVVPAAQLAKVPIIILNLSPDNAIDYSRFNQLSSRRAMTGEWLRHCGACPVPEIANVFRRVGIPFFQITGRLDKSDPCWRELAEWMMAAHVAKIMAHNRLGAIGTYYSGMMDIYTDLTKQVRTFGGHIEILEIDELTAMRKNVTSQEAEGRVSVFRDVFEIQSGCEETELLRAAITSIALERLVEKYKLGSIAYYHKGIPGTENEDTITSIILGTSFLTSQNVPVAGEYEIKNAQAMKILDAFGVGGSFTEYYAMDFNDDVILMGHDGPGHLKIGVGKTKVRPLEVYHGKIGKGLAVEMQVQLGPVTLLSVVEGSDGNLLLLVAHGESVPGQILEIGNTNSRYRFAIGAKEFMETWNSYGPAHHCAVGVGHVWSKIEKFGKILGIRSVRVC
ncbi:arabinose isomerase [Sphingobacterium shayense]|uniref:arabinose isomerase n=1 Tax=Sphingobacterium shayense TaxID=626343 RepID=UPI001557598C|nr:arabinose isomerase [Sphingobacterium shayense]NQD69668.1 arabinose isomerase [Sphingobacterium shayense]